MFEKYGVKIYNDDGSSFVLDSSCSVCKILGVFKYYPTDANGHNRKSGIYVPEEYQVAIGFGTQSAIWTSIKTGYEKYGGFSDLSYYLDENRQVILKPGDKADGNAASWGSIASKQDCIIFAWPESDSGNYGLSLSGSNNFSKVSDVSGFSFVVYKGDVEIPANGWVPSSIDSSFDFDKTVAFFYWDNPDVTLVKYYAFDVMYGDIIDRKYTFYNKNGDPFNGTVKVKVVIFGNKKIEKSQYGLRFYGEDRNDFFEASSGLLIKPTFFSMGTQGLYEFKNVPNINRPMVLPTTIGGYAKGWQSDRAYCALGIANNGHQLAPSLAYRDYVYYNRFDPIYKITNYPVFVIDAESYFKF